MMSRLYSWQAMCALCLVVCRFNSSRFSLFLLGEFWRLDGVWMAFLFFSFLSGRYLCTE